MKNVFLIGAGYVAGQAALSLLAGGHRVTIGKRHPDRGLPNGLAGRIAVHAMDVGVPEGFPEALFEADTVIYCVASDGFTPQQYQAAYADGLAHVLEAFRQRSLQGRPPACQRLIFVSSTGVYGQSSGERVDETSPAQPTAFSGQIMRQAEEHLAGYSRQHAGLEGCVVRFSGIYGPGRTRMIEEIRNGKPVSARRWSQYTNRIHRDDCAAVLVHLVERDKVLPVYVASDTHPAPFGEIATWMAGVLGLPAPAILDESASEAAASRGGPRASGGLERGGHKQCWSSGLLAEGFRFRYPGYREGYGEMLAQG